MSLNLTKMKKVYYFFRNPVCRVYCFILRPKSLGVKILVENEGKFLMVKISYAHRKWTFPGGGVKRGESFKDAAKRELMEEVGIKAQNLIEIGEYTSDRNFKKNIVKCFYLKSDSNKIKIDNFEISEANWYNPEEMPLDRSFAVQQIMEIFSQFKRSKNIKAIVFDYGGVIRVSDFDLFKEVTEYLGIDRKEFKNVYLTFNHLYNVEGKEYGDVLSIVAKKFNASDEQVAHIHELCDEMDKTWKVNNEVVFLIKNLKKNYRVGLLSNFNSSDRLRQIMIDQGTRDLFDEVVVSCDTGYQKPDPKIFEILFKKLGVKSEEVIFIDDAKSSLVGAEEIGYTPILFRGVEDLKKELKRLNIKID